MERIRLNDTYTILEEIGSGGGGIVYKAYHENLRTEVVVKQVRSHVKKKLEGRAEADILLRMKHTYLPRVYDFLEIGGKDYTVMDYIPGRSLDKELEEKKRFPQDQVLRWTNQLAQALDYLHSQDPPIIHSDIKPANIMLTPEGNICLIDFNISLVFDKDMRRSVGVSRGYSPPEQYHDLSSYRNSVTEERMRSQKQGDGNETETMTADPELMETELWSQDREGSDETESLLLSMFGQGIDERSDIYSLGITIYHLLTGICPSCDFRNIVPVEECGVEISEGFAHIINKMMELAPEDRYQNGSELLYALSHIYELDSEYQAYRKGRRNRKILIAALFLSGALLTGISLLVMNNERNIRYNQLVTAAGDAMDRGNYGEAQSALEEARALIPSRSEGYRKEALLLYQQGDYENCIRYISDVIQNAPYQMSDSDSSLGELFYIMGNAYLETEDYSRAVSCLKNAVAQNSENSLYYRDYAVALVKLGNIEEAENVLTEAIDRGLGEDSIYMVRGEIMYAKGEYEQAETYLLQAIATAQSDTLRRRAVLLCDRVYRAKGGEYLDTEIAFLEQEVGYYAGTSSAMNLTERLADAYVRKAIDNVDQASLYYEKALAAFDSLYQSGYTTRQIMENIAILCQQLERYGSAREMLLQMTEQYPDDYVAYKRLAFLEADEQQRKENEERSYEKMKEYYDAAKASYGDRDDDQEMQMLDVMIQDLIKGNWL